MEKFVSKMEDFIKYFKSVGASLENYIIEEDNEKFKNLVILYNEKMDCFVMELVPEIVFF